MHKAEVGCHRGRNAEQELKEVTYVNQVEDVDYSWKCKDCLLEVRASARPERVTTGQINAKNLMEMAEATPTLESESSTTDEEADEMEPSSVNDIGLSRTDGFSVSPVVVLAGGACASLRRSAGRAWVWGPSSFVVVFCFFLGGGGGHPPSLGPHSLCGAASGLVS